MDWQLSERTQNILGWIIAACVVIIFSWMLFWPKPAKFPPIFDVQMHYNQDAWGKFSPRSILGSMKELGVRHAAVSSAPNEGTFRLYGENLLDILPLLTPYKKLSERHDWYLDTALIDWLQGQLRDQRYRGVGELHLVDGQVTGPVVDFIVRESVARNMVLLAHSDVVSIKALYRLNPDLRIIWAHAGMTTTPLVIDSMFYKYPRLMAELSHRGDMTRDGELKPEWRRLLLAHAKRFMVGTGTYNNGFWYEYPYTIGRIREWLQQLPREVAEDIGYRNALRIFNGKRKKR